MYKLGWIVSICGVAIVAILLWGTRKQLAVPPPAIDEVLGVVRYVVDGDSLYVDGHDPQIRLWGVDAPEKNESGSKAATDALKRLTLRQPINCQKIDTDHYGRTVARCFLKNGREINAVMISSGTTTEYYRFSNGFYADQLKWAGRRSTEAAASMVILPLNYYGTF